MFSGLKQGSQIYILDKKEVKLQIGEIIGITSPQYNAFGYDPKIDIKVKVDNNTLDLKQIYGNLSTAIDESTGIIITETKEAMSQEVDNIVIQSKQIIDSIPYHQKVLSQSDQILKQLNPRYAKEQERDEDIANLKSKVGGMENKLDKIYDLLAKPSINKQI